jgi:CheY-like chemotaxis protein
MGGDAMAYRVLVVDDNPAVRKAFSLSLEETGYAVETAESGEEGLERLGSGRFHLVLLDLKMPGMNGIETLREIRKQDPSLPVYIVTAFHKEFLDDLKGLQEEGVAFELLKKPIGGPELVRIAQGVLEGTHSY